MKKALDELTDPNPPNFIFLGDLNTMGIDDPVPYSQVLDFSPEEEILRLEDWAGRRNMVRCTKETTNINGQPREVTWWNGSNNYVPTNLYHVVASDHMDIRSLGNGPTDITLFGWPDLPPAQWNNWYTQFSDHALLYFEVWQ